MTNHEIEKLAKEYCHQYLNDAFRIEPYFSKATDDNEYIITQSFKAGYLKGVEAERKRCIEITNKIIEKEVSPFGARSIKEQIERGDK